MKLLINASNIKFGGGLQVAISVITSLLKNSRGYEIKFIVSENIFNQLEIDASSHRKFIVIDFSAKKALNYINYYSSLRSFENDFKQDVVFTIFGPSFYRFRYGKSLIGFANAWLVNPDTDAYRIFAYRQRLINKLKNKMLSFFLYSKNAHYVTETKAVAQAFCKCFKAEESQISVVNNTLSYLFTSQETIGREFFLGQEDKIKFLTVSHNYLHKNIAVIEKVGQGLSKLGYNFTFVVTFSDNEYLEMSDIFRKYTTNVGPVSVLDCPNLYKACNVLFLPTLIECFTVSYLEAMYFNMPIATSDRSFAREICSGDAYFFDPFDVENIVECLVELLSNLDISQKSLINEKVLSVYGTNEDRVDKYINLISNLKESGDNV